MHMMKPNTLYKIITVHLVCPAEEGEASMADGINEMLREVQIMDNPFVVDYAVDFGGQEIMSDGAPEEGDLVPAICRSAKPFDGEGELCEGRR